MPGRPVLPRVHPRARSLGVPTALLFCGLLISCNADRERAAGEPAARAIAPEAAAPADPDIAPDTSFVVFTAVEAGHRDIFRLDTVSGVIHPLTESAEDESHPRVSHDGTRVAFLRETATGPSLWVANSDGTEPSHVATGEAPLSGPAWSPDGARLLVASAGRLLLVSASGGKAPEEAGWPAPDGAAEPTWGADGTVVVSAPGNDGADLYLIDTSGDAAPVRLTPASTAASAPRYADGRLLYLAADGGRNRLFGMRRTPNGFGPPEPVGTAGRDVRSAAPWPGTDRVLAAEREGWAIIVRDPAGGSPVVAVPPDANNMDPVFDASGENIFYTSDIDGNEDIYVVELIDFTVANLTTGTEADYDPDYSVALGRLVFVTEREGNPDILSIDQSGLDDLFLTSDPAADTQPRFSPDGAWVAFVSDRAGSPDIWMVKSGGGEPHRITTNDTGAERSPTWVDDGAGLIFEADWGGRRGLWRIGLEFNEPTAPDTSITAEEADAPPPVAASGNASALAGETSEAESVHPMAAPDGRRVAYTRLANGDADLWALDLETGQRAPLVTEPQTNQDYGAWSGDGVRIAYQDGGAARLVLRQRPASARSR